jgi:hypothetical protein
MLVTEYLSQLCCVLFVSPSRTPVPDLTLMRRPKVEVKSQNCAQKAAPKKPQNIYRGVRPITPQARRPPALPVVSEVLPWL